MPTWAAGSNGAPTLAHCVWLAGLAGRGAAGASASSGCPGLRRQAVSRSPQPQGRLRGLGRPGAAHRLRAAGFTLMELLVVVAIIAFASAGVSFALRDTAAAQLEREALRLASLFESARAQSRASGVPLRWRAVEGGFRFEGAAPDTLPGRWLGEQTQVVGAPVLLLGPEPVIGAQEVVLVSPAVPQRAMRVSTDGLRPFSVAGQAAAP